MVCTNMTENVTTDILTDLYNVPVYVAICVTITVAVELIGNGLLAIVIMYEKFGMDSQKRTTINQLVSKVCWISMMTNLTVFPFVVIQTLFGPQSQLVGYWLITGTTLHILANMFTLTEMMMLKCLYLFVWPRMVKLDDTFAAKFLVQWNVMISSLCTFSRLYLSDYHTNPHFQFVTGRKFFKDESDLTKTTHFM
jgi:hypothetical protein